MKIVKKDGRLEEFNINKIKTSIENAAIDSGVFLNSSDLKVLAYDVEKALLTVRNDSRITSSYEVIGIIFSILRKNGFKRTLKAYLEFAK